MTQHFKIGWDIGGAHVKAALINPAGEIIAIFQEPCPLWKGLSHLQLAVNAIMTALPTAAYCHAMTMTGELVDLFADRDDGVRQILLTMKALLGNDRQFIFAGKDGLLAAEQVTSAHYLAIASANWLATAHFAAQKITTGVLVDIGSTTTDILFFNNGKVHAKGYTDYQRLASQELVYTGIVRTAVMAVVTHVKDGQQTVGVMAEYFATMADVYRLTGELNEAHDQTETADGAEKTIEDSARRLARMLGCDFHHNELSRWQHMAADIRAQHVQKIQAAYQHMRATHHIPDTYPLVGAGVGRFLVQQLARDVGQPYRDFSELCRYSLTDTEKMPADCAPSAALACLMDNPCQDDVTNSYAAGRYPDSGLLNS